MMSNTDLIADAIHDGNALVITLHIDEIRNSDVAMTLRETMMELAAPANAEHILLDFSRVRYMGTIGFLALMRLRRELPQATICLCGLHERVAAAFEACKLTRRNGEQEAFFLTAQDVPSALASIAE